MNKLIIAFLCIALTACQQKEINMFEVKGVIKNAPGKKLLLMEIPYGGANPAVLDSQTLGAKGDFTLKTIAKGEHIYSLALENGPDVILVNDNRTINVQLDVNNYRQYTVEGSPASQSLHTLFEDYSKKDSTLFTTFRLLDTLQKTTGNDSMLVVVRAKRDEESKELNTLVKNFVSSSESPAARYYAIGLASRTVPPEELKPLIDQSVAKFKDHEGLAGIQKMMASRAQPKEPEYRLTNQQAPDITMADKNGKMISLSSFKGKYVLVDFWASWCGPCRKENPNVVAAYNAFKNKNFTILGVSLDQEKSAWLAAIAKDNLTWTHISDLKQWESPAVTAYGIEGIPFNVLVDPAGKIIASNLRGEALEMKLAEVLK